MNKVSLRGYDIETEQDTKILTRLTYMSGSDQFNMQHSVRPSKYLVCE